MTRAILYTRVSTDEQADSRHGLNAQADACKAAAVRLGLPVAGAHSDEGICGATGLDGRPGLMAALDSLRKGDVLLVAKRDRLARDPILSAMVEAAAKRKGARVVSAAGEGTESDDPASVLMRRLVDSFSEYERLLIGARTKAALQGKRKRLERVGAVSYGFRLAADGKTMEPHPTEQAAVKLACELRARRVTLEQIGRELTAAGFAPRSGGQWAPQTIKNLTAGLAAERLAG